MIVQGPIVDENDFTLESVRLYLRQCPSSPVIVSTWNDTPADVAATLERLGATVILNEYPASPGWGNVNYQIRSTASGLKAAAALGCTHAMKTRSDWRLYKADPLGVGETLMTAFPLAVGGVQRSRILTCSVATLKYRVYGISDMLQFGTLEDLQLYWSAEEYEEGIATFPPELGRPPIIDGVPIVAEIYLCIKFLQRCGVELDFTLDHWWQVMRERFCVFDAAMLDAYWDKYERIIEYRFARSYIERGALGVEFTDWLDLYVHGSPTWGELPHRESWTHEARPGLPFAGGIYQEAH